MSLIDDALKRAQEAAEKAGPARERPWVPAPLPDPAIARRRRVVRLLAYAAAAAGVVVIGVWAFREIFHSPVRRPSDTLPPENRAVVAPVLPTPQPTLVAVEVSPPPFSPRPTRAARPTPNPDAASEETAAPDESSPAPRPAADSGVRVHAGSVVLPGGGKIELGGIVWSETEPRALVNDRIVGVGGYVEGYTITKIEEDRITLEKDGATLVLAVK